MRSNTAVHKYDSEMCPHGERRTATAAVSTLHYSERKTHAFGRYVSLYHTRELRALYGVIVRKNIPVRSCAFGFPCRFHSPGDTLCVLCKTQRFSTVFSASAYPVKALLEQYLGTQCPAFAQDAFAAPLSGVNQCKTLSPPKHTYPHKSVAWQQKQTQPTSRATESNNATHGRKNTFARSAGRSERGKMRHNHTHFHTPFQCGVAHSFSQHQTLLRPKKKLERTPCQ